MSGVKISQLPSLLNANVKGADSVPIVDSFSGETKQVSMAQLDLRWQGVPNGGTTQQILAKASSADKNVYWKSLSKNDVGLGLVDNTSDANKPISIATQAALNLKANQSALALKADVSYVNSQVANKQDKLPIGVDGEVLTLDAGVPTWKPGGSGGGTVTSVFGRSGPAITAQIGDYDKTMIGLPNVDDTSDLDKPISNLTQLALNGKEDSLGTGANGQVLTMIGASKGWANLPTGLPSMTGNAGKFLTNNGTTANWDTALTPTGAQTVTNKDIDGGVATNTSRQTLPKDQMSGLLNLNRKEGTLTYDTQSKQPVYDDGTSLVTMGPEVVNFIKNGKADFNDLGWNRYVNAAGAVPVDGTGGDPLDSSMGLTITTDSFVLSGHKCFELHKYAGNAQGKGFSYDFTIDRASLASMLTVTFDYEVSFGTFNAGSDTTNSDLMIYLYDITNNKIIYPQGGSKLYSTKDQYRAWFQSAPDSYNYRLILHCATTNTAVWSVTLDNFSVSRTNYAIGTIITDWGNDTISGTWTTNTTYTARSRRVGDTKEYDVSINLSGAPNSSALFLNGLQIDTSKLANPATSQNILGHARFIGGTYYNGGVVLYDSLTSVRISASSGATGNLNNAQLAVDQSSPFTWGNGNAIKIRFSIPIVGWSAGARMSDGYDGRVIAAKISTLSSTTITANTPLSFTTKIFDETNSLSSSTFIVPSSGLYRATLSGLYSSAPINIYLYKNGIPNSILFTTDSGARRSGSTLVKVNTGDTLFVSSTASGTATSTVDVEMMFEKLSGSAFMSPTASVAESWGGTAGDTIGVDTLVKFITKDDSTHGAYSPATGLFTCPATGRYSVSWGVALQAVTLSTAQRFLTQLFKGASLYRNGNRSNGNGASNAHSSVGSVSDVYLIQGETLSVRALSNVSVAAATASGDCYFSIIKVG